jgi:hypothetical protein
VPYNEHNLTKFREHYSFYEKKIYEYKFKNNINFDLYKFYNIYTKALINLNNKGNYNSIKNFFNDYIDINESEIKESFNNTLNILHTIIYDINMLV